MAPDSRPTMKDIAARAGVSATTVSYALRGQGSLSRTTRDRVLQVARQLGYTLPPTRPGQVAIAVAYPFRHEKDLQLHCIYSGYARGVQREAARHANCTVTYTPSHTHGFPLDTLIGGHADGFLFFGADESDAAVKLVLERDLPTVLLNHRGVSGASSVSVANRKAVRELTRHLVEELERRNLAFVESENPHSYTRERLAGCRQGLQDSGYEPANLHVVTGEGSPPAIVEDLLQRRPRIDAIVTDRDPIALGLLPELMARGVRVPDDLALTGFDDTDSATAEVPITTVGFDFEEMGYQAVALLLTLIAGELVAAQVEVPYELILRQSCGCSEAASEKRSDEQREGA